MSWIRIWVHLVFSTKNGIPFLLTEEIGEKVFNHISENAKEKDIWMEVVGGHKDHVRCLISLGREQTLSKVVQLIKGESSFWINKNGITPQKFSWQDDFWAVSISESHVDSVRNYINNQEEHHRVKTFNEEVDMFMKKYGWKFISEKNKKCG